ncbi:MAG: UDP-glucose 4-epimerase GalE [Cyclobacteriaceae bacterium]|nr:UDP-glucose 4-epimerase GalE [Cyclobacteriaceae bacterium HetDA_MAG_MS6]
MSKVLVTGGTGYIGSHTVVELQASGYEVIIADDLSNSKKEVLQGIEKISGILPTFYEIDICNKPAVEALFDQHQIDAIVHFAASKAVGESVEKPLLYYKNNLISLVNLLEIAHGRNASLVFSSSCTVYGEPDKLPVTERSPIKPAISPYGNTKQIGEEIIRDVVEATQIQAISLRYFNPIGAHDSVAIGEYPQGVPNNLVPYLMQVAAGEREQLSVFGDDYSTPDGTCIRDYIHVVDLAKAHVIAVDRLLQSKNDKPYEVFNLGTGKGYSVLELIKTFEQVTGVKLNYAIVDRRAGDIEKVYADTTFANDVLGWKAGKELDEMLLSSWKWQQSLG